MGEVNWDRFDKIGVVDYIPYRHRYEILTDRLSRVGLFRAERFWDYDSPFKKIIYDNVEKGAGLGAFGALGCTLNHYRIIKTFFGLGAKHCLIMEDDVVFNKDIDIIASCVDSLPEDYDVAMFDWFGGHATTDEDLVNLSKRDRVGGHWVDIHGITLVSAGMYALSRRGMDWLIGCLELGARKGHKMRSIDTFFRPGRLPKEMNAYACFPHVAIQGDVEHGVHKTSKNYNKCHVRKGDFE